MRTHIVHMHKAQNSLGTPAGKSHRTWRAYRPRQLAHEGGGSAAARAARLREYHVLDQHAEAPSRAGTRSLHRAEPFFPHRDSRVFVLSRKSWVRKVLVNFLECPGGACNACVCACACVNRGAHKALSMRTFARVWRLELFVHDSEVISSRLLSADHSQRPVLYILESFV
jgi:hypothetical protein